MRRAGCAGSSRRAGRASAARSAGRSAGRARAGRPRARRPARRRRAARAAPARSARRRTACRAGSVARSSSATRAPARARRYAAVEPAGPAPTTTTSNRSIEGDATPRLQSAVPGVFPSGQRGRAVNPLAQPSEVRILPPPSPSPRKSSWPQRSGPDFRVQAKGTGCKPVGSAIGGSNPPRHLSTPKVVMAPAERAGLSGSRPRGRAVNPLAQPSEVRILPPPPSADWQ